MGGVGERIMEHIPGTAAHQAQQGTHGMGLGTGHHGGVGGGGGMAGLGGHHGGHGVDASGVGGTGEGVMHKVMKHIPGTAESAEHKAMGGGMNARGGY
jgi:hypothetical protein